MSGANMMPHSLTGGAGYKANASYDEFLRKHSGFYRKHSAASSQQDSDRRASQQGIEADVAQAQENVRRGSVTSAAGGAAAQNSRKGSVAVASDVTRKDSIYGLEATAGTRTNEERRPSTSLASDLFHKIKGNQK